MASISAKKSEPEKIKLLSYLASCSSSTEPEKNKRIFSAKDSQMSKSSEPKKIKSASSGDVCLMVSHSEVTPNTKPENKPSSTSASVAVSLLPIYCLLTFPTERYVSLDCEMISIYSDPKHRDFMKFAHAKADLSRLAKAHGISLKQVAASVAVVSQSGEVIFFAHINWEPQIVSSYQTEWSGITAKHLEGKKPLKAVTDMLMPILKGNTVIGAAIHNDLAALNICHDDIWDIQHHYGQRKLSTLWA
ncbi:Apoptosis-enhancing nuclease-like protein [Leptotrombidium deliense]|uniref:Apoptosis-enhancing nuclease-like protein n=1 Tax=Leptotrombidium deliense TaxID=299467 RepID=A0A443RW83_9ACAR|nr:Apoptosis-enhancing nuclease-like protein [Leptotrombidium deliense]